jgi:hypothetical protein
MSPGATPGGRVSGSMKNPSNSTGSEILGKWFSA